MCVCVRACVRASVCRGVRCGGGGRGMSLSFGFRVLFCCLSMRLRTSVGLILFLSSFVRLLVKGNYPDVLACLSLSYYF